MTAHRDVLQTVVQSLQNQYPNCSLLLTGSLMRGAERSDSDIDLFGAFSDVQALKLESWRVVHSRPGIKVLQTNAGSVPITCTCVDVSLLKSMAQEAWRNRLFARSQILCDPTGVVRRCQAAINDWFKLHPDVDAMWTEQEQEHSRCKAAIRQGRKPEMKFPTWDDFADHVDRFVKQQDGSS